MIETNQRFTGHWMMFDHEQRVPLSTGVHLWAGPASCGFELSDGRGGEAERIAFDDRRIVWAITCMIRLMRRKAYRVTPVPAIAKPRARGRHNQLCAECGGQGEAYVDDRLVTCPACDGNRYTRR